MPAPLIRPAVPADAPLPASATGILTVDLDAIVENLGVVRGIMVRSRSVVGNLLGGFQTLFGGNITIYTNLCEQARAETYREMFAHARQRRANAIIGTDNGTATKPASRAPRKLTM